MTTFEHYKQLLAECIAHKSISTDPAYELEIHKTAEWFHTLFLTHGMQSNILTGYNNPVVYASYEVNPNCETVLLYGHYDVQPADKTDGWTTDPFTLVERNRRLYGRGVVDNKGQTLIHITTILELIREQNLAYNCIILLEGNEETLGTGIERLLQERTDLFTADHILISDGEIPYRPVLTASLKGTFSFSLKYTTASSNLHSGLYGGIVPNAAEELSKLVATWNDSSYNPTIPEFLNNIHPLTPEEKKNSTLADETKEELLQSLGVKKTFTGKEKSFSARVGFRSLLTVTGFKSGYIGNGFSNSIPSTAEVKINVRVAHPQKPENLLKALHTHVAKHTPNYVTWNIKEPEEMLPPVTVDITSPKHQETIALLEKVYNKNVLIDYCGGTLPVVLYMQQNLGRDPLLVSLGNDDCNMHGIDENFDIGLIHKGLTFSRIFFAREP